jgi:hypothetical protein
VEENQNLLVYSPDLIVLVEPETLSTKIEKALAALDFEKAVALAQAAKPELLLKAQNKHLHYLATTPNLDSRQLPSLLQTYLEKERDRWVHWCQRLIQHDKLHQIVGVIPT